MILLLQFFHQLKEFLDPRTIATAGYLALFLVIFAETGLAAGFFFPGDSLLVVAGLFAAKGSLNIFVLIALLFVAAVTGDATGYYTGAKLGPRLFTRKKSFFFRPSHLQSAQTFYLKHGNKTIIIARFIPIVRTFAPIVAGAAKMPYRQFVLFNVIGGGLWVSTMLLTGFFLGSVIPNIDKHIEKIVILIIAISLLPPVIEYIKAKRRKKATADKA
jgi:membrane-associated protein